jgi:CheY-like chemotaxis protein
LRVLNLPCPACAQSVAPIVGPTGHLHCPNCNLVLSRPRPEAVLGRLAIKRVSAAELKDSPVVVGTDFVEPPAAEPEANPLFGPALADLGPPDAEPDPVAPAPRPTFFRAVIAEDTELHRQVIADGLRQQGLCAEVVATSRGDAFITAVVEQWVRHQPPDLCVLDLEMPGLSGYHAAVALRAVERAFAGKPTPVVFFTARICDPTFKRAMDEIGSATYLNKAGNGPADLFARLAAVLRTFSGQPALDDDGFQIG